MDILGTALFTSSQDPSSLTSQGVKLISLNVEIPIKVKYRMNLTNCPLENYNMLTVVKLETIGKHKNMETEYINLQTDTITIFKLLLSTDGV